MIFKRAQREAMTKEDTLRGETWALVYTSASFDQANQTYDLLKDVAFP
jgi:hypothetical protein